jgi:hypothetical protein
MRNKIIQQPSQKNKKENKPEGLSHKTFLWISVFFLLVITSVIYWNTTDFKFTN